MASCRLLALAAAGLLAVLTAGPAGADAERLNRAGKAAYQRGDFVLAERLFSQALVQAPSDPLLHYHRGVALTRLERWHEAAAAYNEALRLGPPPDIARAAAAGLRSVLPPARRAAGPAEETIRLARAGGVWTAEVVVNDGRTARFIVDTGAAVTVISPALVEELGLRVPAGAPLVKLRTPAGEITGPAITVGSIRLGETTARGVDALVHEIPGGEGLLGNSFLSRYAVTLDPAQGTLSLRAR
jgi:clan AA aspartic protease (TIGR02281 family)